MTLSSSRVAYRHRCTIERDANQSGTDQWGNPTEPGWQSHLADQPCRAWTEAAREPVDDHTNVVLEDRRVSLAVGTDVTEADRVASVTDKAGTTIFEGPMGIEGITRFPDHLELLLERIR